MKRYFRPTFAALTLALAAAGAHAQSLSSLEQRDVNQETRIRNGLQDGSLNTREAALLERREAQVDRMQARDLKDGKLTAAERRQIERKENQVSRDIYTARHNGVNGDPFSASSQRMQGAVQRDINQEQRIVNGINNGSLTNRETGRLEAGQARTDAKEFRAGRDGYVGAREAQRINQAQNHQSERIYRLKHNASNRG